MIFSHLSRNAFHSSLIVFSPMSPRRILPLQDLRWSRNPSSEGKRAPHSGQMKVLTTSSAGRNGRSSASQSSSSMDSERKRWRMNASVLPEILSRAVPTVTDSGF